MCMSECICAYSVSYVSARALLTDATGFSVAWVPNICLNMKPHKRVRRNTTLSDVTGLKMMSVKRWKSRAMLKLIGLPPPNAAPKFGARWNKWKSCFANEQAVRGEWLRQRSWSFPGYKPLPYSQVVQSQDAFLWQGYVFQSGFWGCCL